MDPELEPTDVKQRAVRGAASLLLRQLCVRVLGFAGMLILARILTPEIFGIFAIAQFIILFFEQLSTLGLAAALIRRKQPVTEAELRTVFTVQHIVVVACMVAILAGAPAVRDHYALAAEHEWFIRVTAVCLLLASLKTVPIVLLERALRHDLIARSEVAEYLAYQLVAIALAFIGFGVWALIAALLVRGLIGVTMLYAISHWRPSLGIDRRVLGELLRFGVPIQLASATGLATHAVVPVLFGSTLGTTAVGYANFARSVLDAAIYQPLILTGRVQLRVFGRLQDDPRELVRVVEQSLYVGGVLAFLAGALVISGARPFIEHVLTQKWLPVLPLIYVLGPAYLLYAVMQPLMQALKALGDARTQLFAAVVMLTMLCAGFVWLENLLGLLAYAVSVAAGIGMGTLLVYLRLRRHVRIEVLRNIAPPAFASIVSGAFAFLINWRFAEPHWMALAALVCVGVYFLILGVTSGDRLGSALREVISILMPQSSLGRWTADNVGGALVRLRRLRAGAAAR